MRVHALEKDFYVAVGDAYDSNCTILLSHGEAFLIDAMASKTDANNLRHLVEVELNARVRFIACTHFFSDHLAALKLFSESEIIAHKNYSHTFDLERFRSEEERSFFVEPTILVSDELSIRWGSRFHSRRRHSCWKCGLLRIFLSHPVFTSFESDQKYRTQKTDCQPS
jgi:glyoxylase-like metal-dependent hydrolase (beta-lactamase superfamily II)